MAVCGRGLAYYPYSWAVFALAASSGLWKRRWVPTPKVAELREDDANYQASLHFFYVKLIGW